MEGYIKLHRQITENEFWHSDRFSKAQAWIDLLLLATYKARTVFIRGIEIKLNPGELCYSQLTLAKRWKWNFKTVVTFLKTLENRKMLETKTSNVTTIISIKNWKLYQASGEQSGDQTGEQKETRTETNKNVKKEKKVKNIYAIENLPINLNGECFIKTKFFFATRALISELKEKLGLDLSDESLREEFYGMEVWIESHKPKQDYKMFFVNWLKNAKTKKRGNSTAFKRIAKGEVTDQQLAEGLDKAFQIKD